MSGRIRKEYREILEAKNAGLSVEKLDNNFTHWRGWINGPEGTPYEGGKYFVDIHIPEQYPFVPPKMKFTTKIWHPNVSSQTGAICLDILKDEWSPALTIRTALLSLQALLSTPEPDDPQDAQVAGQYKGNYPAFVAKAKEWTRQYAGDPKEMEMQEHNQKIQQITDMGFSPEQARVALEKHGWNVEPALNSMLM